MESKGGETVKEKATDDLRQELMEAAEVDTYLSENQDYFIERDVSELLTALYKKRSLSKAALARKAGMSEVYLHQVFSGRRKPSRDRLLCLCIGLEATLDETQQILRQAAYAPLYPKRRRDAILIHGLLHGVEIDRLNDKLFTENEKTLF